MATRMIELNLAAFAGGVVTSYLSAQFVMPYLLGDETICLTKGGLTVTKPSTLYWKLAVEGIAFFLGMILGQYFAAMFV